MKCPVCESDAVVFDDEMHLYRCHACDHLFTKLPKESQETYEEDYFEGPHRNWFANPDTKLFGKIEASLRALGKTTQVALLDAGCGRGDFLKWVHAKNPDWNLTGIDLAPNSDSEIRFIQGDIFEVDLEEKFDVIVSLMVVEHLEEIRPFITRMRSLLKEDGVFVVNTFNNDSMIFRIARLLKKLGMASAYKRLYSPHHLQHYSRKSIRMVVQNSGFEVLEHRCHNYPLKAVDVPPSSKAVEFLNKCLVGLIFWISDPLGQGIEHTLICRPSRKEAPA